MRAPSSSFSSSLLGLALPGSLRGVLRSWVVPFGAFVLLLLSSGLLACATTSGRGAAPAAPLPSASDALESLRARGRERKNLRALGRVTYFGDKGRVRVNAVLVAERPGRFRFETISPLEQPLDVMASDGERLWLLSKDKISEGPATPENIARLLPLPMFPEEVVDTLLGGFPTSLRFQPSAIAWEEPKRERWVLTLSGGDETLRLFVEPERRRVEKAEVLDASGRVRIGVTFEDFVVSEQDKGEIPRDLQVVMPASKLEVSIKLKEVDVNVALADALFHIQAPPGIQVERFDTPDASATASPEPSK